ncbi:cholesterol 7-desaturase nvd [Vanessa atalanta]|uniref:cholesterol 7-desaturase nvd n=1 Tax=Vanessa atalanta TaxID=42275 RepID=UPI001FCE030E|nr:cholesterol 7-desaturase nvd [Vanessa atalanta]
MAMKDLIENESNCQNTKVNELYLSSHLTYAVLCSIFEFVFKYFKVAVFVFIFFLFIYILYKSYWSPVFYAKELSEVGFNHIPKGKDRSLHIIRAQKARRFGSKLPPPYPNGWFALVESRDLVVGGVVAIDALGLNLCVYRGEDETARVVDAYCPHLGANLAIGGNVCGNCIECPFHQWKFGEDGQCVSIPHTETVPKGISIKTYPSMEIDGTVWVWYDAEGRPPLWTVEESDETKNWGYRGRNEFLVNAHIQEIPENGADVAHLNAVHNVSLLTDVGYKYPFLNYIIGCHNWSAEWSKGEIDHLAQIKIAHQYIIMKFDVFPINVTVHQIGPAHVRLRFHSPLGPMTIIQSVTPIAPLVQKVVHRVYTPRYNAILGAALVLMEAYQFARDVAIWNNKRYVSSPAYVKNDKTIRTFRSWFSQFYSEQSVSLKDALQNPLDW